MENGGKRAVLVWHRRAGKDSFSLNWTAVSALHRRKGVYWHMLPTAKQGRKVVWDSIDYHGRRVIDQVFPPAIRRSTNQQEMRIELINGSIWQVVGSDNYDSLVGANPIGVVFSEYSVADPAAWRFLSPILAENGGWSIFIYTPRGKNHGYKLYKLAKKNNSWFDELLPLDVSGAYPVSIVDEEIAMGMPEEIAQQEYFCSFDAAVAGSLFGKQMNDAVNQNRITSVPWEPSLPVDTGWDLGMNDDTVAWFSQTLPPNEIRIIDVIANRGEGLEYYAKQLKERPYSYGDHFFPHDVKVREMGTGKSRLEILHKLGIKGIVVPKLSLQDGISALRGMIPKCYFDERKCETLTEAMMQYRTEFDEKHDTHRKQPVHDWSSHYADAGRTLAIGLKDKHQMTGAKRIYNDFDPLNHNERSFARIENYNPGGGFDEYY